MALSVNLAGTFLEHPIMNAAGTCKLLDKATELTRSAAAAVMVGSITVEPRVGNAGEVYWGGEIFSLNSLGLPNPGAQYYKQHLPAMVTRAHGAGKALFVSVAGFSPNEYAELADIAFEGGADLVELNLGCPNVWEGSEQKRIACFDVALVAEILQRVEKKVGKSARVAIKISHFSDPWALAEAAQALGQFEVVKVVTAINAVPNAFSYDETGKSRITPGGGLAGLGGQAIKPICLGQIIQLKELLPEHIQIIGVGGITCGKDVLEYQQVGAVAIQIATTFLEKGAQIFSTLLTELTEITNE